MIAVPIFDDLALTGGGVDQAAGGGNNGTHPRVGTAHHWPAKLDRSEPSIGDVLFGRFAVLEPAVISHIDNELRLWANKLTRESSDSIQIIRIRI